MMNEKSMVSIPYVDDVLAQYPSLRLRVEELERRLRRPAPHAAERVRADLNPDRPSEDESDAAAAQPQVIRSIIDLVEGRSLHIERALSTVLGVSERELLQSSYLDRVHPDDLMGTIREMELLAGGKMLESFPIRHRHADGTYRRFEWSAVADDAGELCYAVALIPPE